MVPAGFTLRTVSPPGPMQYSPVSEMYMFPSASRVTSVGPHKPAFVAGPPSPSFEPPSPATVVSFGFGFEAPSSPPIAPQPANTTPQIRSAAIDLVDNTMGRLMRGPPSVRDGVRRVKLNSQRPVISNTHTILPTEGTAHHSIAVFLTTFFANFRESPKGEVRRNPIPRKPMNKPIHTSKYLLATASSG